MMLTLLSRALWTLQMLLRSTSGQTLLTSAVTAICGFGLSIYVVRRLGVESRGALSAAQLWPALLVFLASMGFLPSIQYHVSRQMEPVGEVVNSSLWCAAIQSCAALAIGYFALPLVLRTQSDSVIITSRIGLLLIPASLPFLYILSALQGQLRFRTYNFLRASVPIISVAIVVLSVSAGRVSVRLLVVVPVAVNAILSIVAIGMAGRFFSIQWSLPDFTVVRSIAAFGMKAQSGEVANLANLRLDQVLLAAFLPAVLLGRYVIALSASTALTILYSSLRSVVQPRVANAPRLDLARAQAEHGMRQYFLYGGGLYLLTALAAPTALALIFGHEARSPTVIASAEVLAGAVFLLGVKEMAAGVLQAVGEPWLVSRCELLASLLTIVTLFGVIQSGNLIAVACVSLSAYGLQAATLLFLMRRRLNVSLGRCLVSTREVSPGF